MNRICSTIKWIADNGSASAVPNAPGPCPTLILKRIAKKYAIENTNPDRIVNLCRLSLYVWVTLVATIILVSSLEIININK